MVLQCEGYSHLGVPSLCMNVAQKLLFALSSHQYFTSPSNGDLLRPYCGKSRLWGLD